MANKVANTIYAIFKREEWEKVANIYSHNGYANQSYKEGDVLSLGIYPGPKWL